MRVAQQMHGDLVSGLTCGFLVPFSFYKAITEEESSKDEDVSSYYGPYVVCCLYTAIVVCSAISWWYNDRVASWMAFITAICSIVAIRTSRFPHGTEVLFFVQYIWQLLIATANVSHTFRSKIFMGVLATVTAMCMSHSTPYFTAVDDIVYCLLCLIAYLGANYGVSLLTLDTTKSAPATTTTTRKPIVLLYYVREQRSEYIALFILIGVFLYVMGSEIITMMSQPEYAVTGGYNIIRASLFGAIGLVAAGAFRSDVGVAAPSPPPTDGMPRVFNDVNDNHNNHGTVLLGDDDDETLLMTRMALDMSEAAMAITDRNGTIAWSNRAFVELVGQHTVVYGLSTLQDVLQLSLSSQESIQQLEQCLEGPVATAAVDRTDDELFVVAFHGRVTLRVKVTLAAADAESADGYVVVLLDDVTHECAILQAQREAIHAQYEARVQLQNQIASFYYPTTVTIPIHNSNNDNTTDETNDNDVDTLSTI